MAFDGTDITAMLLNDFGIPALLSTPGYPDVTVTVIFDEHPVDVMGVQSDKPQIQIDSAYRERVVDKTSTLMIGEIEYRLIKPNSDMGIISVYLART
jgi:hypothetical protein